MYSIKFILEGTVESLGLANKEKKWQTEGIYYYIIGYKWSAFGFDGNLLDFKAREVVAIVTEN